LLPEVNYFSNIFIEKLQPIVVTIFEPEIT